MDSILESERGGGGIEKTIGSRVIISIGSEALGSEALGSGSEAVLDDFDGCFNFMSSLTISIINCNLDINLL